MSTPDEVDLPSDWEDGDQPEPGRRSSRRLALICLGVIAAIILAGGVVVGSYLKSVRDAYEERTTVTITRGESDGERPEQTEGTGRNFLLLGSDKRSDDEVAKSGVTGQRSDVMMLVHVSDDNQNIYVTSFPRDLYVDIPGHGKDRINAALAYGGVPLAVSTVENYVGVPVEHVALIDFDGIQGLVDSLGGIEVEVPQDFTADGHRFTEGTQQMNGEETLAFVRSRKQFADGDFQRNRNQRAVLKAIAAKVISADTLKDPVKLQNTVGAISPYLTTDDGLSSSAMVELGLSLRSVRTDNLYFLSAPHGDPYTTSGGASVVATEEGEMDTLREALREDDMGTYYAENAGKY